MTDRELLELAAKAAGIDLTERIPLGTNDYAGYIFRNVWNPLERDADAFQLAVKLGMHVSTSAAEVWRNGKEVAHIFEDGTDLYAATRRAIVRAAAALGEKKDA
jgi:hypothetical protein